MAGDNEQGCRVDRDCRGYYRCLDQRCADPPAVLGRSDGKTPWIELVAGEDSRGRFFVELARDRFEWSRGLSHRPSMASDWGMFFVYPKTVRYPFTMKLMRFPLDIIFIGDGDLVVDIIGDAQPKERALYPASPYRYVLELNGGSARAHGIRVGDAVKLHGVPRR